MAAPPRPASGGSLILAKGCISGMKACDDQGDQAGRLGVRAESAESALAVRITTVILAETTARAEQKGRPRGPRRNNRIICD